MYKDMKLARGLAALLGMLTVWSTATADEIKITSPQKATLIFTNGSQVKCLLLGLTSKDVTVRLSGQGQRQPLIYAANQIKMVHAASGTYRYNPDQRTFEKANGGGDPGPKATTSEKDTAEGKAASMQSIVGTVHAVDGDKRRITVVRQGDSSEKPTEFDVSRKAAIVVDGKTVNLTDLKPGQKITLQYHTELEVVTRIETLASSAKDTPVADTHEVVVTGVGLTPEKALANAFTVAVGQCVGVLVDAKTVVANDQIIKEKILTATNAYIDKYDIVDRRLADGLHHCQIKARVRLRKLQETIVANKITLRAVRGQDLAAEIQTTQKANKDTAAVLNELLRAFPNKVLIATVSGKPKPLTTRDAGITRLRVPIELAVDEKAYASQMREILNRVDKLAIAKFASQFKLLPQPAVGQDNPLENFGVWNATCLVMPSQDVDDQAVFPKPNLLVPSSWFAVFKYSWGYNRAVDAAALRAEKQFNSMLKAANEGIDGGIDGVWQLQKKRQESLVALVLVTTLSTTGTTEVVTYALPADVFASFKDRPEKLQHADFRPRQVAQVPLSLDLLDDAGAKVESVTIVAQAQNSNAAFGFVQAVYQFNEDVPLAVGIWPGLRMQFVMRQWRNTAVSQDGVYLAFVKSFSGHLYVDVPTSAVKNISTMRLKVEWKPSDKSQR